MFPYKISGVGGFDSGPSNGDPWQIAQPANMAQIQDLQVQCEKDMMRVRIIFDRPFYGMVFSKGHYSNVNCVHVPSGLGQTQATFDIALQVKLEVATYHLDIDFPRCVFMNLCWLTEHCSLKMHYNAENACINGTCHFNKHLLHSFAF